MHVDRITMYEVERSENKIRVIENLTGAVLAELNGNSIIIVDKDGSRVAVEASNASNVDLVNALIKAGRI
jgi:hypothetical protein